MAALRYLAALGAALLLHLIGARIHPNLPQAIDWFLPVLVLLALSGSSFAGIAGGLAAGLLQDGLTGGLYGLHGFADTVVGYATARLAQRLVIQRAVGVFAIASFASALQQVILIALSLFLLPQASVPEPFWVVVRALSTGLVGMLIYSGSDRFRKAAESHRKQRLSRLRMDAQK